VDPSGEGFRAASCDIRWAQFTQRQALHKQPLTQKEPKNSIEHAGEPWAQKHYALKANIDSDHPVIGSAASHRKAKELQKQRSVSACCLCYTYGLVYEVPRQSMQSKVWQVIFVMQVHKKDYGLMERNLTASAEGGGFKSALGVSPVKTTQQKGAAAVVPIHAWANILGSSEVAEHTSHCVQCMRAKRKPMKAALGTSLCWACMVELGVTLDNESRYAMH
jgi:hypothetical protein